MPIYARYKEDEYKLPKAGDLKFKDVVKLKEIISTAKSRYLYKEDYEFNSNIQFYNIIDLSYNLATYDINRTSLDDKSFISHLEQLLIECNNMAKTSRYFKYSRHLDIRFDIIGNWTKGEIIVLIKKTKK